MEKRTEVWSKYTLTKDTALNNYCHCCHTQVSWRVTDGVCWSCEDTPVGKMIKEMGLRNYLKSIEQ